MNNKINEYTEKMDWKAWEAGQHYYILNILKKIRKNIVLQEEHRKKINKTWKKNR